MFLSGNRFRARCQLSPLLVALLLVSTMTGVGPVTWPQPDPAAAAETDTTLHWEMRNEWYSNDMGQGSDALAWHVADIDGDGKQELLQLWEDTNQEPGDELSVLVYGWEDGAMTEGPSATLSVGPDALAWLVADVDGDGRDELLQAWPNDGRLALIVHGYQDGNWQKWYSNDMGQGSDALAWHVADIDGDGKEEMLQLWEDTNQEPTDYLCPGDGVCGTCPDTMGMFDPASGLWHVRGPDDGIDSFFFGVPGDTPITGDWDCDGVDTPGMYRPSDGYVYLTNTNATSVADIKFHFGVEGDIPIAGDWNGDGCDTLGVYRQGHLFLANSIGANDGWFVADDDYWFGVPGDAPFAGDFNADGRDTVGLYRESSGYVYFTEDHGPSGGVATTDNEFFFGIPGDIVTAGDWTGRGIDTVAVFRPTDTPPRCYLSYENRQKFADEVIEFGAPGWLPVSGVWAPIRLGWSDWDRLGGTIEHEPQVVVNADGRLEVFVRGTDDALFHIWQIEGVGWSEWESLGGDLSADPIPIVNTDGRLEVFTTSSDDALFHIWQIKGVG